MYMVENNCLESYSVVPNYEENGQGLTRKEVFHLFTSDSGWIDVLNVVFSSEK